MPSERLRDFLYILLRDHVPMGDVEGIMWDQVDDEESIYSNTYLIGYVDDLIPRLLDSETPITDWATMFKHGNNKHYLDGDGRPVISGEAG